LTSFNDLEIQMNHDSFEPSDEIDPELLRVVADRLAAARNTPPTVMSTLVKWPGTPLLVLFGVIGIAILMLLTERPDAAYLRSYVYLFAGIIPGAFLRDLGLARRVAKLWKPQSHFIDWHKVDVYTT
jgi:hypothetical protein